MRDANPAQIVVAVPAAPESTCRELAALVDDVVCASMPTPFLAVGESFWDFSQTSDEEVRTLLATPTTGIVRPLAESPALAVSAAAVDAPGGVPPADVLDDLIGDARIVLIGESSHGTHEFYEARAEITKWLIQHKGFTAVAAEADWPDAYRVNRFVQGPARRRVGGPGAVGIPALSGVDVAQRRGARLVAWLHRHNQDRAGNHARKVGFYGLDLRSLHRSMADVIDYLDRVDPGGPRARSRYACFDHASADDGQAYGYAAAFGASPSCEQEAVAQLVDMHRNAIQYLSLDGVVAEDELFCAQQNAQTVRNAEEYYRRMFGGGSRPGICATRTWHRPSTPSWPTWTALRNPPESWCGHTTHVGDAGHGGRRGRSAHTRTAGPRGARGGLPVDRVLDLPRDRHRGHRMGRQRLHQDRASRLPGSVEELFHETGRAAFLVAMRRRARRAGLQVVRLARAIGVIYLPDRTPEPLLPRAAGGSVRRDDPPRADPRAAAAGPDEHLDRGPDARNVSERALTRPRDDDGHLGGLTTEEATEPSSMPAKATRPWLPTTTSCACSAAFTMAFAGRDHSTTRCTVTSG